MPRLARVVIPGIPHHVTQRGNRRLKTFFRKQDFFKYMKLLAEWSHRWGVEIWAYCLMTNHVHLIAVPETEMGLRMAIEETHRRYTRHIHFRKHWRGHFWQGRFSSFPMDEDHLLRAARYIERNPVDAGIVSNPEDYPWSSARAHLAARDDALVRVRPLLDRVEAWREFLDTPLADRDLKSLLRHERTGRPLGADSFIRDLEIRTGRTLMLKSPGRKPSVRPR
ncbi:MAG: transposase [Pseudomonadota bacterium]